MPGTRRLDVYDRYQIEIVLFRIALLQLLFTLNHVSGVESAREAFCSCREQNWGAD